MNARRHSPWKTVLLVVALAAAPVLPAFSAAATPADAATHAHHGAETDVGAVAQVADNGAPCADHATCAAKCCSHCITAVFHLLRDDTPTVKSVRSPTVPASPPGALVAVPIRPPQIGRA